jgi:hypothetical protein
MLLVVGKSAVFGKTPRSSCTEKDSCLGNQRLDFFRCVFRLDVIALVAFLAVFFTTRLRLRTPSFIRFETDFLAIHPP